MNITPQFLGKVEDGKLTINNRGRFDRWLQTLKGEVRIIVEKVRSKRSDRQNRALHLWFELIALALNDAGYTVQLILKEKVDLDFDKEKVKELLWRPAQKAILGKKSTTELKKQEDIDKVFDHLNRHLGEKFQIHIPFPTIEVS